MPSHSEAKSPLLQSGNWLEQDKQAVEIMSLNLKSEMKDKAMI